MVWPCRHVKAKEQAFSNVLAMTMTDSLQDMAPFPRRNLARRNGPLYQQVAELIRDLINSGALPVSSELPKEAHIGQYLDVSLITVRRALRELEDAGLIRKRSAKPAIVISQNPMSSGGWKFGSYDDLTTFTRDAVLQVMSYRRETSPVLQKHFGMAKGESGFCLRGYLAVGDQRKTLVTTYFPPDIGERLRIEDFTDVLIFRTLERCLGVKVERAQATVRAESAETAVARDLEVSVGSPILAIEMLYRTADQRNVEFTISRNPSELFSLSYDILLGSTD
jgi:GntR family transcriptional regulator